MHLTRRNSFLETSVWLWIISLGFWGWMFNDKKI